MLRQIRRASMRTKNASLIMGMRMRFTMKPGRSSEMLTVLPRCSARPLVAAKTYAEAPFHKLSIQ